MLGLWQREVLRLASNCAHSNDFASPDYYINIRKALVEGYFMQVPYLCVDATPTVLRWHTMNG